MMMQVLKDKDLGDKGTLSDSKTENARPPSDEQARSYVP